MGTTRTGSRRGIIAVMFVSAFVMFAPVVVFAQSSNDQFQRDLERAVDEGVAEQKTCAQEPRQPKCNPVCWQQEQCKKEKNGGVWEQSPESEKNCPSVEKKWGYCFPPNVETTLQIPIGGAKDVADVGQYIKIVYLFLLGIGGLVGAIVLIHAGFLWLASGGNSASVERAKKHIQDAAIGLLLLFGSYTILSAINPDLVKLRVPKAQLLRNVALEFEPKQVGKMGGECNVADSRSVNECQAACPGCQCLEFDNAMVTLAQVVSFGAVAAAGATMLAGTAVAQVGIKVLTTGGKTLKYMFGKVLSFCGSGGVAIPLVCALGAGTAVDDAARKLTGKGICIPPAQNLEKGALCAFNNNCKSGKCVGGSTEDRLGLIGVCGDGTEGSPCESVDDCSNMPQPAQVRVCADGPGDTKWCTTQLDRPKGNPCRAVEEGGRLVSECGPGLGCLVTEGDLFTLSTKEGIGWCVGEREAAGGPPQYIGDTCAGNCPAGLQCHAEPGQVERCTMICDSDASCAAVCPPDAQPCYCGDQAPRICVKGARVVAAPAQVEILQNGGTGCNNPAVRRCADGLVCTADAILYRDGNNVRGPSYICTDKRAGSLCSSNEECLSGRCEVVGALPNQDGDPEYKCA